MTIALQRTPLLAVLGPWQDAARRYPVVALGATGLLLGLSMLPFAPQGSRWLFAIVTVGGGLPLAWSTLKQLARREYRVDLIATLAIAGSALLGEFLAGAVVVLMQAGGEALEDYGLRRARQSLDNLLKRAPSVATRQEGEQFVMVPAAALRLGDTILVRPGDIIAADGVVTEGYGSVDEAALTGEPVPLPKQEGDRVFSGTINLSGNLLVRTTSTAAGSKYEAIVRMVQQAQGERAPISRLADRYTPLFTWVALGIAAAAFLWHREPVHALAVLVVATPCPLIIATPLAVLSAVNRAAALNIIVKSGAAIEQAGRVQTVVFDKTGTLTTGEPSLAEMRRLPGGPAAPVCDDAILAAIAAVELVSPHALAAAVVRSARQRGLTLPRASDVVEAPGTGVSGTVEGRRIAIGSGRYVAAHGVAVPEPVHAERARLGHEGKIVACVGVDRQLTALLVFEDRLRPEAAGLLQRLRALGITHTFMLTGDAAETAQAVAGSLGIGDVRARLQPEDKVAAVRALAAEAPVMMVGDGINDAPALATASVGVAMGGYGAGIATDAADIVITVENVERVADTIALGRRMVAVARQGILLGIGASVFLMILAGLGCFPPAVGALLQELIDLAAILNALRVR